EPLSPKGARGVTPRSAAASQLHELALEHPCTTPSDRELAIVRPGRTSADPKDPLAGIDNASYEIYLRTYTITDIPFPSATHVLRRKYTTMYSLCLMAALAGGGGGAGCDFDLYCGPVCYPPCCSFCWCAWCCPVPCCWPVCVVVDAGTKADKKDGGTKGDKKEEGDEDAKKGDD